ncbi:hypothetical protein C943_00190 [Mariniradius saccharolyticus AK6]|uniref:Uncharacterized protein n=1 Tax=Mariniradius saccharolyticus AK6 TaxID=1239962 RepID=M7Y3X2_9BACT|nr:hypothetical protein C943_00190 [Mariniradius saccharolyticus AK6]
MVLDVETEFQNKSNYPNLTLRFFNFHLVATKSPGQLDRGFAY